MAAFRVNDGGLTGRIKWTDEATVYMLNLIRDLNAVEMLASKRQRNKRTFMAIQDRMFRLGHEWSWQQIRCHWKNLKSRYNHVGTVLLFALRPGLTGSRGARVLLLTDNALRVF